MNEWDRLVNSKWPKDMPIPTAQEAIAGAKRLYKKAMGYPYGGQWAITSGNRFTWPRRRVFYVNPNRSGWVHPAPGWPDIVHLMAHWCHRRKHPNDRPHSYRELELEKELTNYVLAQGFHEGKLKRKPRPKKAKPPQRELRLQSARDKLKRWETKKKRAETAIKHYQKKVRYYEKRLPM